jgi:hypothetical protein
MSSNYPKTKEIIYMLGMGTMLLGSILMPGLGAAAGVLQKAKRKYDFEQSEKEWKKFNLSLLRRNLKRLQDQKFIEFIQKNGQTIIKLTKKGHSKYLQLKLEELTSQHRAWDGKWRIL